MARLRSSGEGEGGSLCFRGEDVLAAVGRRGTVDVGFGLMDEEEGTTDDTLRIAGVTDR